MERARGREKDGEEEAETRQEAGVFRDVACAVYANWARVNARLLGWPGRDLTSLRTGSSFYLLHRPLLLSSAHPLWLLFCHDFFFQSSLSPPFLLPVLRFLLRAPFYSFSSSSLSSSSSSSSSSFSSSSSSSSVGAVTGSFLRRRYRCCPCYLPKVPPSPFFLSFVSLPPC